MVGYEELPEGNYLIRLKSHTSGLFVGPVIPKSRLTKVIEDKDWVFDEVVIEDGNLNFSCLYN
jgi:hypothetical protein